MKKPEGQGKENRQIWKGVVLITQIGIGMMAPIALGAGIGYFLDQALHLTPVLFLFFLVIGMAAGYRNVWQMVKSYTKDTPDERLARKPEKHLSAAEQEFIKWKTAREDKHEKDGDSHEKQ